MSIGPFETEREASSLPQVRAIYEAFDADPGAGKMAPHNRRLLDQALEAAGVEMGAFDDRIAGWLAGWEPHVLAVIAGWASRANRAEREQRPALDRGAARRVKTAREWLAAYDTGVTDESYDDMATRMAQGYGRASVIIAELLAVVDHLTGGSVRDEPAPDDERCCPDCNGDPHHLAGGCQDAAEGGQR